MNKIAELFENPLFLKEMRLLFRSPRTPLLHFSYLLVLGCGAAAFAWFAHLSAETGGSAVLWRMGAGCFKAAYALHLAVVGLFAASMASVAVSSEKERRTWDLLAALPMGPAKLLLGKYLAICAASALMVGSSLPLWLFTLSVIGGVSTAEMAASFVALLGVAALSAAFGLFASTLFDDSRKAFGLAFRVLLLCGGAGAAAKAAWAFSQPRDHVYHGYGRGLGELVGQTSAFLPVPESAAGSLGLFAVCALFSVPLLTLAVDALKPADERRPDRLHRQLFAISGLAFAAYLGWIVQRPLTALAAPLGTWPSALQGMMLMLLSVAVLPTGVRGGAPAWSGGPAAGSRLLFGGLAVSALPLLALSAFALPTDPRALEDCLAAEVRVACLILLWASIARMGLAWAPRHARAAYFGGLLALVVVPAAWAALDGGPTRGVALRLLELNPVLGAGLLDKGTAETLASSLHQPWEAPVLALILSAGFLGASRLSGQSPSRTIVERGWAR
ncbi:MAG: ABC transporter permease [Elusimicrobia bacterium]|nr:ABC transporter permease [Elusimicrobiota bacterium]